MRESFACSRHQTLSPGVRPRCVRINAARVPRGVRDRWIRSSGFRPGAAGRCVSRLPETLSCRTPSITRGTRCIRSAASVTAIGTAVGGGAAPRATSRVVDGGIWSRTRPQSSIWSDTIARGSVSGCAAVPAAAAPAAPAAPTAAAGGRASGGPTTGIDRQRVPPREFPVCTDPKRQSKRIPSVNVNMSMKVRVY